MYYRARPPLNRQNYDNSCWAAAIDSFSRVNSRIPTLRENDLAHRWGDPANDYGLTIPSLYALSTSLATYGCRLDSAAILTLPYDVEDKLRKSHVVFIWQTSPTTWHAGLAYGIDNSKISYMETRTGEHKSRTWGYFANPTGYYMIWRP